MIHSRSKAWVRLMGLGLALLLMCPMLPAYAFAEEPSAEGSAAAQSAETEPGQAAPETDLAQAAPEQAQPETETAQPAPETAQVQTAPEPAQPQPAAETPSDETAVEPVAGSINAAIYYLADPAGDPLTNNTGAWAPSQDSSTLIAQIDTTGASWDHNDGKNITTNVASYITAWPDGSTGSTWTVKRDDPTTGGNFTYILDSIWTAYEAAVKKETGQDVAKEDVTEITLTPRKISRNNGGRNDYHLDCALSVTCKKTFTAKFWVKEPGGEYKQVDAKNYKTGDLVQYTANVSETYTDANGKLYTLDGWYVEDGTGSAPSGSKATFPHAPTEAQLTDGVVNYYAHYVPVTTSVTVTKQVTGPMGNRYQKFSFQWSCGEQNGSFTLSDGQSFTIENVGVGETLTLTESDNSGYAVSVNYNGQNCTVDAQSSVTITVAQDGGPITVTNSKDVNPDTGITLDSAPYAVALGLAAVTAAVLLYRRSRRRG